MKRLKVCLILSYVIINMIIEVILDIPFFDYQHSFVHYYVDNKLYTNIVSYADSLFFLLSQFSKDSLIASILIYIYSKDLHKIIRAICFAQIIVSLIWTIDEVTYFFKINFHIFDSWRGIPKIILIIVTMLSSMIAYSQIKKWPMKS